MPAQEIVPFAEEHLEDAAMLLADRHARHRQAEPLLPDGVDFRAEVEALWAAGASGAAATREGRLGGYLLGVRRPDAVWGPNIWVELAGHAATEAELVRDLYAAASPRWAEEGRTRHYALVPAGDATLVDAWFRLSFGTQHAFGIRDVPADAAVQAGVREATEEDLDALVALAPLLAEHQALAPVFSGLATEPDEEELRREIAEDVVSPEVACLVADVDGRIAGNFLVVPVERSSMHAGLARPPGAALLAWAATLPELRGTGVGLTLTDACFAWARARRYATIVTDWRVTNLLSSRFWPQRGFRPTFLRLYRSIP